MLIEITRSKLHKKRTYYKSALLLILIKLLRLFDYKIVITWSFAKRDFGKVAL